MADLMPATRVRVKGFRQLAGTTLPLWCNGQVGAVLGLTVDSRVLVKLDGVTAAKLIFLPDELEPE